MNDQENVTVREDADAHRFVIEVDGAVAGFARYRRLDNGSTYDFVHTEIDPAFEGRGLGSTLVSRALEHTRELGHTIVPHCPFVAAWLRRHPEFVAAVEWPDGESPMGEPSGA
ncbi:GNAT family N-acetyltransferase [Leucobacter triazinivorans]|uniref:N-acetyltransferase n=1 Tax=Leucobacter triazinivorans TaxID=1784719 RepID=A0A4V0Z1E8_9MICO|nr:GNAT family N-acetyltransferase [Leucobacter triazinivorans]QBE48159.1 N-acetyltransferase [Leucobacter triazinivorans]